MSVSTFSTRLAQNLSNPRNGVGVKVIAEGAFVDIEVAVCEGPAVAPKGVQRFYASVRQPNGRVTTFVLDVPVRDDAEAGSRVFCDRRFRDGS